MTGERAGRSVRAPRHPDPPATFAFAVIAMVLLAMLFPGLPLLSGPWRLSGLLPVLVGAGLHHSAWRSFRARRTTVRANGSPSALVTDGPYARTRNPMYLAGIVILSGLGLLLGATPPLLVPVGYGIVVHRTFLPAESRIMEERFGGEYRAYRESVPAWL